VPREEIGSPAKRILEESSIYPAGICIHSSERDELNMEELTAQEVGGRGKNLGGLE
jgi:hypothetical protein